MGMPFRRRPPARATMLTGVEITSGQAMTSRTRAMMLRPLARGNKGNEETVDTARTSGV
jgi:hypothetical protein